MNKQYITASILIAAFMAAMLTSCDRFRDADYLKDGFINPPDSCKPGVYWYFMDGNLDREAITRDLESMKKAGIGYVLFLEVNVGVPRGSIDFLSEEWQEIFTHAVRETERLGIRLIMGSGPGWAGSGGPWVRPEESMMHLVTADTVLSGPSFFNSSLPLPAPKTPFFGEASLTAELRELRNTWYEDVRVLAFPMPLTQEKIDMIDEKAIYYRAPYTSQPGVLPFMPEPDGSRANKDAFIPKERIIDLTNQYKPGGNLTWNVPPGKWIVVRFVKRNNGAVTRPAPIPGLGFEADKFDTAAFRSHYENYIGKLLRRSKPAGAEIYGGWKMIHIDSWEMGAQNWSHSFIEEFIKRRGYDPVLWLPAYAGYMVSGKELSERFLWDVRKTAGELVQENHAEWFRTTGRKNGFRLSIEPYDMNPASDIDLGAIADIPMCEFWSDGYGFNSSFSCLEATSIAHVTGKPVVAAEAFTANRDEAWKLYPGNMKNQTDWALATGINRIIFHTFAHKPYGDHLLPGITMGPYGVHWDRGQTWWPMVEDYHLYIARSQFVLSMGRNVADILYLTPEGAPMVFVPPADALDGSVILPDKKSFAFDACSPALFMKYASVQNKRIIFPGGASYKILVLPDVKTFTPELVKKVEGLIKSGAVAVGMPPEKSPSLVHYPECDEEVKRTAALIWRTANSSKTYERNDYFGGTLFWPDRNLAYNQISDTSAPGSNLYPRYEVIEALLKSLGNKPDFISAGNYRYIHRSLPDRDIYFVSNRTGEVQNDSCFFRDGSLDAELWDPVDGTIKKYYNLRMTEAGTALSLKLYPYQSCFMIFYHNTTEISKDTLLPATPATETLLTELRGPWRVKFNTVMGGPEITLFDTLSDWRLNNNEGIKYYSGIAGYSTEFTLENLPARKDKHTIRINVGEVRNMARIRLNGIDLGVLWTDPWEKDITGILKKGDNLLEIDVANLWMNRLIGDEEKPWDGAENGKWPDWLINGKERSGGRYTFTTLRYYRKGDTLSESGLLGPVRIIICK